MNRRKFLLTSCALATLQLAPGAASARVRGSPIGPPTGQSVINGFQGPNIPFKNLMLMAGGSASGLAGLVDNNGYLTSPPASNTGLNLSLPSLYFGRYRIYWGGTGNFQFQGQFATIYDGGAIVTGLGGNTGQITNNFTISGSMGSTPSGYVEFDFGLAITGAADNGSGAIRLTFASVNFDPTGTVSVSGVGGVPNATGQWSYTRISATQMDLVGSTFAGTFTSGGRVVFQITSNNSLFLTSGTYSGFSNLIICRSTAPYAGDLVDIQSGDLNRCFNDDFLSALRTLNPSILRFLDASGINGSNITKSTYVPSFGAISYNSSRFPSNLWAGSTSGTDQYTCGSYPDMPGSWTDKETFNVKIINAVSSMAVTGAASNGGKIQLSVASTATLTTGQRVAISGYNGALNGNGNGLWTITVDSATQFTLTTGIDGQPSVFVNAWSSGGSVYTATINCGSRGAKILANGYGANPGRFQTIGANSTCTCVYDAALDCILTFTEGLKPAWPLAVRVALSNKLNKHYWHEFHHMFDDASVTVEATYIASNLGSLQKGYFEYSNEMWNTNFNQTQWAIFRGQMFGFPSANSEQGMGWTGMRHRQMMGIVTPLWSGRSGLQRVLPWQAVSAASTSTKKYLYEGFDLNGTSFPAYAAAGNSNYDTAPNRPVDYTDCLSYAPYYNGATLTLGGLSGTYSSGEKTALQTAADDFFSGNTAAAFAWMDNDIRAGTKNTVLGDQTLSYLNSNYYPGWQSAAALYGKSIVCYESGYQGLYPSAAQWDIVFGSGGATYGGVGGRVYNMWLAYKYSATFKATVRKQWDDQRVISATLLPSWYVFGKDNNAVQPTDAWSMCPGQIGSLPYFASYTAMSEFNG